jgi:hypothetical protein
MHWQLCCKMRTPVFSSYGYSSWINITHRSYVRTAWNIFVSSGQRNLHQQRLLQDTLLPGTLDSSCCLILMSRLSNFHFASYLRGSRTRTQAVLILIFVDCLICSGQLRFHYNQIRILSYPLLVVNKSRDQNEGRSHNIKIYNSFFERVEHFKYLGTTLTNKNSVQDEIKSSLKSGNACYHLMQNLLSSSCNPKI